MKTKQAILGLAAALALSAPAFAQSGTAFTNFVRQVQVPSGVERDVSVAANGTTLSPLAIDPGGARFELWTVKNTTPPTSYLIGSQYVGTYVPKAEIKIETGDTEYTTIPRTRADQGFKVILELDALSTDPNAPDAARMVDFLRHVQSYGTKGTGVGINRTQATLLGTQTIAQAGKTVFTFSINQVPGANRAKVRGEERFSAFSLEDYQAPPAQLDSKYVQIWPVADGSIAGIDDGQLVRFKMPTITIQLNDLYPGSTAYTQVYKGSPALGKEGFNVPGGAFTNTLAVPQDKTLVIDDFAGVFDEGGDGLWTMEVITKTPFGLDRLDYVYFNLNRTIRFNGSITSQE